MAGFPSKSLPYGVFSAAYKHGTRTNCRIKGMQTLHEQGILEPNMQPSTKPSLSNPAMFEKCEARNFGPVFVLAKATAPLVELKTTIRSSFTPFVEDSFFSRAGEGRRLCSESCMRRLVAVKDTLMEQLSDGMNANGQHACTETCIFRPHHPCHALQQQQFSANSGQLPVCS